MRRLRILAPVALFVLLRLVATNAQQSDRARALDEQIGRIFQANDYQVPRFGPARWLPDGTAYTVVEPSSNRADMSDIVRYDAATGARTVLIAGSALIASGQNRRGCHRRLHVVAATARVLLIFTNTRKVWRDNTRGDYWVVDLERAGQRVCTSSAAARSRRAGVAAVCQVLARFDTGRRTCARNDIYVERLDDGGKSPG